MSKEITFDDVQNIIDEFCEVADRDPKVFYLSSKQYESLCKNGIINRNNKRYCKIKVKALGCKKHTTRTL